MKLGKWCAWVPQLPGSTPHPSRPTPDGPPRPSPPSDATVGSLVAQMVLVKVLTSSPAPARGQVKGPKRSLGPTCFAVSALCTHGVLSVGLDIWATVIGAAAGARSLNLLQPPSVLDSVSHTIDRRRARGMVIHECARLFHHFTCRQSHKSAPVLVMGAVLCVCRARGNR